MIFKTDTTNYFRYWGKASPSENGEWDYHLLPYHCLDVAAVGKVILQRSSTLDNLAKQCNVGPDIFLNWFLFVIAIHDIGKFSNGFQAILPDICRLLRQGVINSNYRDKHWSIGFRFLFDKK